MKSKCKRTVKLGKYDPILKLWANKEKQELQFHEIKEEMEKQGWYERKIIRYLNKMLFLRLLEKKRIGTNAFYSTTNKAKEYSAISFFDRVRQDSSEKGWISETDQSFLIFGLPPKDELTSLEQDILKQINQRINNAFLDLHALKRAVLARKKVNQPLSLYLLLDFLLEDSAIRFRREIFREVYDADTNDIQNVLEFAKQRGVRIPDSERYLEIENQWLTYDGPTLYSGAYSSYEEATLAVLMMLSPELIREYALDSFFYLKHILQELERHKIILKNEDLIWIARQFLKIERWAENPHIRERALALRTWSWLRLKIGNEKTEKLAQIIVYLWKNPKTRIETVEEKDRSHKLIHVLSDEEVKKEIDTILKESSKIDFSKPER